MLRLPIASLWLCSVALPVCAIAAEPGQTGSHLLFDFESGAQGWSANVFGKGKMEARDEASPKVGQGAIAVRLRDLRGANLISPAIRPGEPWRLRTYDRARFWAKAGKPMTKAQIVFKTNEKQHSTYSLAFPMLTTEWTQHTYPLTRCWNRGRQKLNAARVQRVYITGSGNADFSLDHIELLEAARQVYLTQDRHVFVAPTDAAPVVDGRLDDPAWSRSTQLTGFLRYPTGGPAQHQTEAWVTYDRDALYIAARLHVPDASKLKATETARDASVWRDDCLEVFVDPGHSHAECYQFVVNSIGSQMDLLLPGGEENRGTAWNGKWTAAAAVGEKAWTVEMRVPFTDLGHSPQPGDSWGFNVCREAPSVRENSFWTNTGGKFTRMRGLADLVFGVAPDPGLVLSKVCLEEREPGSYILRAATRSDRPREVGYKVWAQTPDDARTDGDGKLSIPAGEGNIAVPVEFKAAQEGEAKVWFHLSDPVSGAVAGYGAYSFKVAFPSQADLSRLVLVPSPKELRMAEGAFEISGDTRIRIGRGQRESFIGSVIQRELRERFGVTTRVFGHQPAGSAREILVGRADTSAPVAAALADLGLSERLAGLKPEGYVLVVQPERVVVAGRDDRGTYYAARTFLQLVLHGTPDGQALAAPCCTVVDWPDMPFRGYMIFTSGWPQDPLDEDLLKELIYREVAGYKYNALVWQMKAGYQYSRTPRLSNRCALSRETVQEVAQFARNHFIEIIPNTNILGHANWIVLKHKDLQEDGKPHQLCTQHPKTYPLLFDVLEEMLDVFDHPKRLHVGLDEVRWKTFNLPENQRCPRCRGIPKWKIYADHVNALRDFLHERGVEMWMWGDMLLQRHNGGPPFDCCRALDHIAKDVVICNWSAEYAKGSCEMLASKGFRVVKANSRQVPAADAPHVFGNLASFWYRHPWCPMSQGGERGLMMETAYAAQYSWHINRESVSIEQYKRQADLNVLRLVARPRVASPSAGYSSVDLSKVVNRAVEDRAAGDGKGWADLGPDLDLRSLPSGDVRVGMIPFKVLGGDKRVAYLTQDTPRAGPVRVHRKAASVAFLHTAVFPDDPKVRKAYLHRFLAPVAGVPVAAARFTYANGDVCEVPLRVGMEVGSWRPTRGGDYLHRCPYILRLVTEECRKTQPGATDVVLYAYEWVNPRPQWRIDAMEVVHSGVEAAYALAAVSTRGSK